MGTREQDSHWIVPSAPRQQAAWTSAKGLISLSSVAKESTCGRGCRSGKGSREATYDSALSGGTQASRLRF
jgi:hypothetical protein